MRRGICHVSKDWLVRSALAGLIFVSTIVPALSEDATELSSKLTKIRADVESAESDIAKMKAEFSTLVAKRNQLEESLRKIKEEDKAIQRKIGDLKARAVVLSEEVEVSEKKAREQQVKIQARLKAMYINSAVSVSPIVAGRAARGDLERLSLYARKVRDLDSKLFKDASDAVAALIQSRAALDESLTAQESLREQLSKKRKDGEVESAKLKGVTEELRAKQQAAQASLALLQSEAKKVEEMIASLTSGGEEENEGDSDDTSVEAPSEDSPIQKTILHPSLFEASSKASAPVKGEVLQAFGRSKLTSFADMIRSKGIEFSTPANSEVFAVLAGKVVFSGTMPGYDQVVVIEHGGRSYSLYGRLGSVDVKTGDLVEKDQRIATTSSPDEKGRNFYFEVRRNGAAVNPESVLTRVSR